MLHGIPGPLRVLVSKSLMLHAHLCSHIQDAVHLFIQTKASECKQISALGIRQEVVSHQKIPTYHKKIF
jgi:hypothetical protein